MWGKISTVVDQFYEILNNPGSNGKLSNVKAQGHKYDWFDGIIKCFPSIFLVDFAGGKKRASPSFGMKMVQKFH